MNEQKSTIIFEIGNKKPIQRKDDRLINVLKIGGFKEREFVVFLLCLKELKIKFPKYMKMKIFEEEKERIVLIFRNSVCFFKKDASLQLVYNTLEITNAATYDERKSKFLFVRDSTIGCCVNFFFFFFFFLFFF